ncbi:DUF4270 family protein [Hymenobacter lapidiphilus]|uniref:DUF4270 family protein n=1 Tax=Hymenobacter lapidiphilus TaxID=2608003 RepID=A0A7Y7PPF1_9BACT|nr:DUF4270 family protein [Hymenobacter lapidiphilus]NVO31505.1 DUF4270 family protein [Hymenobacter lapidiphilus]
MNWPTSAGRLSSVTLLGITLLALASSCEKANDLGLELPGTSPISATYLDLPLRASTVRQPVVQTVKANSVLVGRVRDSFVGTTTAAAALNLLVLPGLSPLDSLPAKFVNPRLDSAVFVLAFDQVYGSAVQPLRLDVLPLQQPLDARTVYNSTTAVATGAALVSNFTAVLNRDNTVRVPASNAPDTISVASPQRTIRIPLLKSSSAAPLVNSVFAAMTSNSAFNQNTLDGLWKGVLLRPSEGHVGNVISIPRASTRTVNVVTFYFRTGAEGKKRTYSIYLANIAPLSGSFTDGRYFTQLTTDLAGTPLAGLTPQNPLPSSATNGLTYVQEGVGLSTRLEFEGLEALRDKPTLVINRAELLIPVRQLSNGLFPYPSSLYLYEVNEANQILTRLNGASTVDRLVQQEEPVALPNGSLILPSSTGVGYPASVSVPLGQNPTQFYSVGITQYLQAFLQNRFNAGEDRPSGLLLSPALRNGEGLLLPQQSGTVANLNLNRAQLDANNIRLRVYYSKLQ